MIPGGVDDAAVEAAAMDREAIVVLVDAKPERARLTSGCGVPGRPVKIDTFGVMR